MVSSTNLKHAKRKPVILVVRLSCSFSQFLCGKKEGCESFKSLEKREKREHNTRFPLYLNFMSKISFAVKLLLRFIQ